MARVDFETLAHLAYDAQQAALVQLGGSAGSTWETLQGNSAYVAALSRAKYFLHGGKAPAAFNTVVGGGAGATISGSPKLTAAVGPYGDIFQLGATTLTGQINIGDTIVVAAITYTVQELPSAAASNTVQVRVGPKAPAAGIAINTAFSAYTVIGASAAKAQYVFDAVCIAASGSRGA